MHVSLEQFLLKCWSWTKAKNVPKNDKQDSLGIIANVLKKRRPNGQGNPVPFVKEAAAH